jgi:hypothetical protein
MKVRRTVHACTATAVVLVSASAAVPAPAAMESAASSAGTPLIVYQGKIVG